VLTMDAVDTFIADCHAALQETSPEPAPRGRTGESQEGGWDTTPADVQSIDGRDKRVPNHHVRPGEGASMRLCPLYRKDLDRKRSVVKLVRSKIHGVVRVAERSYFGRS